ncbi:ribonuclease HI [Borrelia miyamotoi]|uniref:Ribonuclease H family protein n=1 Tax=Borrelia miyamotoi TaxID=47466 RepID=A0AAX3JLP4_9SPIR|nr:ribonuclease H family protein [Borrelia miyamotoi]QFP41546.1 ribonuclease HI [Borrelia miyamotoi]QFP47668.1 ribonuclease H family protein [Borrelia miyamotoi]QGT55428.1 ribonuclease HI [Borrelia miyamotoi]QGT56210.1 ribonuclease HI [Borrelia miyamotoi]WAZ71451.1 ribonuclease H family protein [Borrelia miyamotoi]
MKKYYACILKNKNEKIIFTSWEECKNKIKGQSNRIKSFQTRKEAENWLLRDGKTDIYYPEGIYFDSGTGRGKGIEIRVVNEKGMSIINKIIDQSLINDYNNYNIKNFDGISNNYGELFGLYIALKIALEENIKSIFGDSKLVIDYWSKGFYNKNLNINTIKLIQNVTKLRNTFEEKGGKILLISGNNNIADLGFHKR